MHARGAAGGEQRGAGLGRRRVQGRHGGAAPAPARGVPRRPEGLPPAAAGAVGGATPLVHVQQAACQPGYLSSTWATMEDRCLYQTIRNALVFTMVYMLGNTSWRGVLL